MGDKGKKLEKRLWDRVRTTEGAGRAEVFAEIAKIENEKRNFEQSLALCETARDLYEADGKENHVRELINVYRGISANLSELERKQESISEAEKMIPLLESVDSPELGEWVRHVGRLYFSVKDYHKSIELHEKAMQFDAFGNDIHQQGIDCLNLAMAYNRIEQPEISVDFGKKALEIFKGEKAAEWIVHAEGELCEAFVKLENPVEIDYFGQRALDWHITIGNEMPQWWLKLYLGMSQRMQGDLDKASDLVQEARSYAQAMACSDIEFYSECDEESAKLFELNEMPEEAEKIRQRLANVNSIKGGI